MSLFVAALFLSETCLGLINLGPLEILIVVAVAMLLFGPAILAPSIRRLNWLRKMLLGSPAQELAAERAVGADLARAALRQMPLDADATVQKNVQTIGSQLVAHVPDSGREFQFQALQSDEMNAFALPGGFIFVARGLLKVCANNADEVAAVLAHEMGHVVLGHARERLLNNLFFSAASLLMPSWGYLGKPLQSLALRFLNASYSQDCEFAADRFATNLLHRAGFDPTAAIRLLERLKTVSPHGSLLTAYLSTHPPHHQRISAIQQALKRRP